MPWWRACHAPDTPWWGALSSYEWGVNWIARLYTTRQNLERLASDLCQWARGSKNLRTVDRKNRPEEEDTRAHTELWDRGNCSVDHLETLRLVLGEELWTHHRNRQRCLRAGRAIWSSTQDLGRNGREQMTGEGGSWWVNLGPAPCIPLRLLLFHVRILKIKVR